MVHHAALRLFFSNVTLFFEWPGLRGGAAAGTCLKCFSSVLVPGVATRARARTHTQCVLASC